MAEALARREIESVGWSHVDVRSAGIAAGPGEPASAGAVGAARRVGLELEGHRSRRLTAEDVEWADLILVMSPAHAARVEDLGGPEKVALLGAFAEGEDDDTGSPVPDPFGGSDEVYDATLATLSGMIRRALRRLEPMVSP